MRKKTSRVTEPIILFMLVIITVMEFLIYGGGVASGDVLGALNAMVALMLFGSTLVITTILVRIYELIAYPINHYVNYTLKSKENGLSEEKIASSAVSSSTRKKKSTRGKKSKKQQKKKK